MTFHSIIFRPYNYGDVILLFIFFQRDLLPGGDGYVEDTSSKDENEDNSPDISLVTGRVRTGGQGKES